MGEDRLTKMLYAHRKNEGMKPVKRMGENRLTKTLYAHRKNEGTDGDLRGLA